jgi:hypothetical protein
MQIAPFRELIGDGHLKVSGLDFTPRDTHGLHRLDDLGRAMDTAFNGVRKVHHRVSNRENQPHPIRRS